MEAAQKKIPIGQYLLERGLISDTELKVSLDEQRITKKKLGAVLVQNGFLTQRDLIESVRELNEDAIINDKTLITHCPAEILVETKTMIFAEEKDKIFLGTQSPEDHVRELVGPYYPACRLVFSPVDFDVLDDYLDRLEAMTSKTEGWMEELFRRALQLNATDIHIEPRRETYSVFLRRLGVREHYIEGSLDEYLTLVNQIKENANLDIAERRIPQDGGFYIEHNGRIVDLRIATLPQIEGEKITVRVLDPDNSKPTLEALGISHIDKWRKGTSNSHGICLICGPTGSGKTTTLNASVRSMDRFSNTINSLEDPVEYRIPYVGQTSINPAVELTFSRGLKALLRNDPDVAVIGEIRDVETGQEAIRAAETGHLVIGTLHTGSVNGAMERLRDMGLDPKDLKHLIRAILVQRLVREFCHHCKGHGCKACNYSGYSDRTVVSESEYFETGDDVMRAVEGESWWEPMVSDAADKFEQGITGITEILRVFGEPGRAELIKRGHDAPELDEGR